MLHPSGSRRLPRISIAALWLGWLLLASPAGAEIAVFSGGGFTKVTSFEIEGERVRLTLPSGGQIVVPLLRVVRILDDEITSAPPPSEPEVILGFDPSRPPPSVPYGNIIHAAAERHGLSSDLVAAVVRTESAFDAGAVSPKGAQGLMQLMPATAERFGLRPGEAFEPEHNIDAGTRYLAWLSKRFEGRLPFILAAYNAGEGTVDRYGGVPPYRETRNYLKRVYTTLGWTIELEEPK